MPASRCSWRSSALTSSRLPIAAPVSGSPWTPAISAWRRGSPWSSRRRTGSPRANLRWSSATPHGRSANGDFAWSRNGGRELALDALERAARTDAHGGARVVGAATPAPARNGSPLRRRTACLFRREATRPPGERLVPRERRGRRSPRPSTPGACARRCARVRGPTCCWHVDAMPRAGAGAGLALLAGARAGGRGAGGRGDGDPLGAGAGTHFYAVLAGEALGRTACPAGRPTPQAAVPHARPAAALAAFGASPGVSAWWRSRRSP